MQNSGDTSDRAGNASRPVPDGACDCHVHVIGPVARYPMLRERAYTPPEASVEALKLHLAQHRLSRTVLIQPSFYGTDNTCLLDALHALGGSGRGVAVIDEQTPDAELASMTAAGVRGVRVNLESIGVRDPAAARRALDALAVRIAPLGWHVQIYAASHVLAACADVIAALPVPVVLDHFATLQCVKGAEQPDLAVLAELVRSGRAYIKLSAPYRIATQDAEYGVVRQFMRCFAEANPARVLWASDWPHTDRAPGRLPTEVSPFRTIDDGAALALLLDTLQDPALQRRVLVENPAALYGFHTGI